ncbi:MAG: glycosyltransferase family 4 protein [Sinobacteraceae bacterium]|nr:glycosyltransferase family 4 protein [Nevskiaceae bacterium]
MVNSPRLMKIAQISPLFEAVPPELYGGTEQVVANLCDSLCDLGHEVVLFAAADARTKARLVPVRERALRLDPNPLKSAEAAHLNMLDEVRRMAADFDILHFHTELLHFPMFEDVAERCVTTLHNRLDIGDLHVTLARWPQYGLVSISDAQRQPAPEAHWLATVLHGIARDAYEPPRDPSGSYLAFLGRISPEKRPDLAIQLALRAGMPLKIAAKVDNADKEYFDNSVKPLLKSSLIEFVGEIGDAEKSAFLGNARALLFPINWPEPFGLVMIESMACGTPVVAWKRGSVPEVIEEGVTGYIVDSEEAALQAIDRAPTLDRKRIRAAFEARFTAPTMAKAYVKVYQGLPSEQPGTESSRPRAPERKVDR